MKREIKFRYWDKKLNEMVRQPICFNLMGNINASFSRFEDVIFQQFTGLLDKNGKEIWEGDILKSEEDLDKDCMYGDDTTYIKYSAVIFKNGCFTNDEDNLCSLFMNPTWYEVVGNIFETPELLK